MKITINALLSVIFDSFSGKVEVEVTSNKNLYQFKVFGAGNSPLGVVILDKKIQEVVMMTVGMSKIFDKVRDNKSQSPNDWSEEAYKREHGEYDACL